MHCKQLFISRRERSPAESAALFFWEAAVNRTAAALISIGLALSLCGCGGSDEVADQIIVNGKVFTANPASPVAEAVALRGDKILAVGDRAAIEQLAGTHTTTIDLGGQLLMPGLIDSHVHAVNGGYFRTSALIANTVQTTDQLAAYAREVLANGVGLIGDVLRIRGVRYAFWSRLGELSAAFDAAPFDTVPVVLAGGDAHSGWGNSLALQRAGITTAYIAGLPAEQRQYFGHAADFTPNGFVVERGWDKLASIVPLVSTEKLAIGAQAGVEYMNSFGITAWLDPMTNAQPARPMFSIVPTADDVGVLPAYQAIAAQGKLNAHVVGMLLVNARSGPEALDVVEAVRERFKNVPNLQLRGIKILADGVAEAPSRTAALSMPYKSNGSLGLLEIDPTSFATLAAAADRRGLVIHVHAIGDRAVHEALNGIAAARQANGRNGPLHSLTHIEFMQRGDIARFRELNVAAAMQLLWSGGENNQDVDASLQPPFAARSLHDAGVLIAGASDWGVSTPNPFRAIATAIGREPASERMPREAMLYAYTRNAATVLGMQDRIGSIEPGKQADFALLDRDVMTVPDAEVGATQVLWTMFGGRIVYQAARP